MLWLQFVLLLPPAVVQLMRWGRAEAAAHDGDQFFFFKMEKNEFLDPKQLTLSLISLRMHTKNKDDFPRN